MKPVPDTEPPVEVTDKEKTLKAGFDLRQSFRRRNWLPIRLYFQNREQDENCHGK